MFRVLKSLAAAGLVVCALARTQAQSGADHPTYLDDPKFQKALAEAKAPRQATLDRLDNWKRANKVAGGNCVSCLSQILSLQLKAGAWKDAVSTSTQLEAAPGAGPQAHYDAALSRGLALMRFNEGKPKPDQLEAAAASLHAALTLAPKSLTARYNEGRALAMLGRTEEARADFAKYLEHAPATDHYHTRVEHFVADPHLATLEMAPPFTLVTNDGQQLALDDMRGKVVLLDFWATWCGPCRQTLPEIRKVAQKFAGEPLIVLSISGDQDEGKWKTFMQQNGMSWPQYRDADGTLREAYGVSSIPRFFTIDTDGALQSVKVGSDADITGDIKRLLKRAHDADRNKAIASDKPAAGQ